MSLVIFNLLIRRQCSDAHRPSGRENSSGSKFVPRYIFAIVMNLLLGGAFGAGAQILSRIKGVAGLPGLGEKKFIAGP
jgi:hypothetical protein